VCVGGGCTLSHKAVIRGRAKYGQSNPMNVIGLVCQYVRVRVSVRACVRACVRA
jgi:hypothetical protein